jgi:hypothetical protein
VVLLTLRLVWIGGIAQGFPRALQECGGKPHDRSGLNYGTYFVGCFVFLEMQRAETFFSSIRRTAKKIYHYFLALSIIFCNIPPAVRVILRISTPNHFA